MAARRMGWSLSGRVTWGGSLASDGVGTISHARTSAARRRRWSSRVRFRSASLSAYADVRSCGAKPPERDEARASPIGGREQHVGIKEDAIHPRATCALGTPTRTMMADGVGIETQL